MQKSPSQPHTVYTLTNDMSEKKSTIYFLDIYLDL